MMKQVIPEISIRDCKTALGFYSGLLGGAVKNLQMSDNLERFRHHPGRVIHSELHVNSRCVLYFSDILDERRVFPGNVTVMLHLDSEEEIGRVFAALSKGGAVRMPLQKTLYGGWHAILADRFGAPWALHCAKNA